MLQWMGGSRRKVAAVRYILGDDKNPGCWEDGTQSHTSVKKRQKQYFEQRRRQQHQVTVGSESYTNDTNNSNQYPREHQSLDILNFLNLSTPTPECKPSCPEGEGLEDQAAHLHNLKDNISGAESSLGYKADPTSPKRTSFSPPDSQTDDFKKANTRGNLMESTEQKLSVFDLVGDDPTTNKLEEYYPSEAHMAFSVEGLGKISTETPVSSPQPSGRTFAYRCSSPWKDTNQPDTSSVKKRVNDIEKEVDTIIQCSKMFQGDHHYRSSVGIQAKAGDRKQKLRTFSDQLTKPYISDSRSYFCNPTDFNNNRVSEENEWIAKPAFRAFRDDEEDSFQYDSQEPCQVESLNANFTYDYTGSRSSTEHRGMKKRGYLETRSNIKDSPVQRSQLLERNFDHPSSVKAAYFKSPENFDFDNVFDQPVWSSIVPEEDKDSLSLRSEESCSSSAAWANETPSAQFETSTRQKKKDIDWNLGENLGDKSYLNTYGYVQDLGEDWEDDQHFERKDGPGKQLRLPNRRKLKSSRQRDSSFHGGLDEPYNWFAEGFTSAGMSSDITTERLQPYPFPNPQVDNSHKRPSCASDSVPWISKFSVGRAGDDEHDYVKCLSAERSKYKLSGDICGFQDNERSHKVIRPKIMQNQAEETSSSVAKSLSDENECNPHKDVVEAKHQRNKESGEKASGESFQQMIMLERHTLQLVCCHKTLLLDTLKT